MANRTGQSATWSLPVFPLTHDPLLAPQSRAVSEPASLTNPSRFVSDTGCGSLFAPRRFGHRAVYQKRGQMLGSFVELRICFFKAMRIVTFQRRFDFKNQTLNFL